MEALVGRSLIEIAQSRFVCRIADWNDRGCVTGFQMNNLREYLKQGEPDGEYQWDYMDGLDELPAEYQQKLKTAVIEGKIADEDWKGVCFVDSVFSSI